VVTQSGAMATVLLRWLAAAPQGVSVQALVLCSSAYPRFSSTSLSTARRTSGTATVYSESPRSFAGALPFAYRLRREDRFVNPTSRCADLGMLLRFPEQASSLRFCAGVVSLAFKLSSGHITIAWSVLGRCLFVCAAVASAVSGWQGWAAAGERGKILVMDVWQLSSSDRYLTLIVLDCVGDRVFLYTRFASVIRKFFKANLPQCAPTCAEVVVQQFLLRSSRRCNALESGDEDEKTPSAILFHPVAAAFESRRGRSLVPTAAWAKPPALPIASPSA